MKIRTHWAAKLDLETIDSFRRGAGFGSVRAIERSAPIAPKVSIPPAEPTKQPAAPNEAKSEAVNAPNEANSHVQAPSPVHHDWHKDIRIDTPHLDRKPSGTGIAGNPTGHPIIDRVLRGQKATLLDVTPILGKK